MILIGSSAIKHHFPDFTRLVKDTDYIGVGKKVIGKIEYHKNPIFDNYKFDVLQPDDLYTLKISHLFWDIKWEKHMYDVQFLKSKNCKLNKDLFNQLYNYWIEIHGNNKRSDLAMSSEDFFNNDLKKYLKYDHDFLHTLIKATPTFTKVLKDFAEVEVDENKFYKLTHQEKLDLVFEEVYVMAYERLGDRDYRTAYSWMLKKFIISHAPMYEALFIIENFKELHKPKFNYVEKINYELSRIEKEN